MITFPPRYHSALLFVFIVFFVQFGSGCKKSDSSSSGRKSGGLKFPVEVATVATRPGDLAVHAVGSVEAFEIVQVTSRISGAVEKVLFREGEKVKAGGPLVEIEPVRFEFSVRSAQAAFERAKAACREAQAGLARRMDIQGKNPGFVSFEDLENWQTKALASQADSAQAAANLELARLNLRDSYVPAPVSGIVQSRAVRTGQYVEPGTPIATMIRRNPLLLRFAVPYQDAQRLRSGLEVSFKTNDKTDEYLARITAVTESADPVTRMVNITAEVTDSKRDELRPGAFAEVTIMIGESQNLPVIPQIAIRPSEKGFLAYVIVDSIARECVLTLGLQSPDGYVEVRNGLRGGETIVVRGAEALRNGAVVRIVSSGTSDSTAAKGRPRKKP
jgi:membrane fusion protein, multidrug efflux system